MRGLNSGVAVLLFLAVGCSSSSEDTTRGNGTRSGAGGFGAGGAGASGSFGAGAGAVGGGAGTGAGGVGAINGNCEEFYVDAEPGIPDFLIVLDRSGSMGGGGTATCNQQQMMIDCTDPANAFQPQCILGALGGAVGGVDRWTPSVAALKAITGMLEQQMRFGLMTYPADDMCGPGMVQVPPAFMTAGAIATTIDSICPGGATPTAASLLAAKDAFANITRGPDEKKGVPYVLLVTDGQPNCAGGGGFGANDEQGSYDAVTMLADAGIRTYVIGYDTKTDAQLSMVLDEMARRGNTGDQAHRAVEDQATLVTAFQQIAATAVSCAYELDKAPGDPSYVLVQVDGQKQALNDPNGWTLNGTNIVLTGDACNRLQDGGAHSLDVQVKCTVQNPE